MNESTNNQFNREQRYFVLKVSDVIDAGLTQEEVSQLEAINKKVEEYRSSAGKTNLECVVVERDWPEYEPTWKAIEQRVTTG